MDGYGLVDRLMIDCSHDNSNKDYRRQADVLKNVAGQVSHASINIMGVMLESHLVAGNQKLSEGLTNLTYGQSITDACIDLSTTTTLLEELAEAVATKQD